MRVARERYTADSDDRFALMSLREDRLYLREVAAGKPVHRVYPPRSSFMGFQVRDLPRKILQRSLVRGPRAISAWLPHPIDIPFGPYGGLLLPRSLLAEIGLPDRTFYLYGDDNEFTARIPRAQARLLLVPGSLVSDADEGLISASRSGTSLDRLLGTGDDQRIYYLVRNQVVFERRHWVDDFRRYLRNRRVYLWLLRWSARSPQQRQRLELIQRAIAEGDAMA
jgi:hypothetical protein